MEWTVEFHADFDREFQGWPAILQDELLAHAKLLQQYGPRLGRPLVDTLSGSRHANMKELRFTWRGGHWRIAFAFDPRRRAILLAGGNKLGANQRQFYATLIRIADQRFDQHLAAL